MELEKIHYDNKIVKAFIIATIIFGIVGMTVGLLAAIQLFYPLANFDLQYTTFGRIRPLHTNAVIFAFGGNALIATSFHVMQRTCRARLADQLSPWFVLIGYNLFCAWAVTGYLMGATQSKEYAEPEWYVDIWLTIVWVAYLLVFLGTIWKRKEPHIYVANWFYLAFIVTIAAIVQLTELVIQKTSPLLHQVLGIYLPLITTNCAVLGVPLLNIANKHDFIESLLFGAGSAIGFSLVLVLFAGIRERVEGADVPACFQGTAIAMVTAGLMSLAFMGFAGLDRYQ